MPTARSRCVFGRQQSRRAPQSIGEPHSTDTMHAFAVERTLDILRRAALAALEIMTYLR